MRVRASGAAVLAASVVLAACSGSSMRGAALSPATPAVRGASSSGSVSKAYDFLRLMMDKYAKGSTTRLVQSFDGGPLRDFTDAVTYDDALLVDALLAEGTADGMARAQVVGNAFLYIQAYDKA